MTLDEACNAVDAASDAREEAIQLVVDACSVHLPDALEKLRVLNDTYYEALGVWAEFDAAGPALN